jgi:hypothetical protein
MAEAFTVAAGQAAYLLTDREEATTKVRNRGAG